MHALCGPGLGAWEIVVDIHADHYREARELAAAVGAVLLDLGEITRTAPRTYGWQFEARVIG